MKYLFDISNAFKKPIYLQLLEQGRKAILSGYLSPGEKLPTIRDIALELGINHHTVAKAYQKLESEGLIIMRQGKGAHVVTNIPESKKKEYIHKKLQEVTNEAKELNVNKKELIEMLESCFDDE